MVLWWVWVLVDLFCLVVDLLLFGWWVFNCGCLGFGWSVFVFAVCWWVFVYWLGVVLCVWVVVGMVYLSFGLVFSYYMIVVWFVWGL